MLRSLGLSGLLLLLAAAAAAQDPPPGNPAARRDSLRAQELPADVAGAVVDFLNDPRRRRFEGNTRIGPDSTVRADIAVLEGMLVLGGRVEGSVVVVNGDVELLPGAVITGDLLVVGGAVHGVEGASVGGEVLTYPGQLRYRLEETARSACGPRCGPPASGTATPATGAGATS